MRGRSTSRNMFTASVIKRSEPFQPVVSCGASSIATADTAAASATTDSPPTTRSRAKRSINRNLFTASVIKPSEPLQPVVSGGASSVVKATTATTSAPSRPDSPPNARRSAKRSTSKSMFTASIIKPSEPLQPAVSCGASIVTATTATTSATSRADSPPSTRRSATSLTNQTTVLSTAPPLPVRAMSSPQKTSTLSPTPAKATTSNALNNAELSPTVPFRSSLGLSLGSGKKQRARVTAASIKANLAEGEHSSRFSLLVSEPSSKFVSKNFRTSQIDDQAVPMRISTLSGSGHAPVGNVHVQDHSTSTLTNDDEGFVGPDVDLQFSLHDNKDDDATLQKESPNSPISSQQQSFHDHFQNNRSSLQRNNTGEIPELHDDGDEFANDDLDEDLKLAIRMSTLEAEKEQQRNSQRSAIIGQENNDELDLAIRLSAQSMTKEEEDLAEALRLSEEEHKKQEFGEKQLKFYLQQSKQDHQEYNVGGNHQILEEDDEQKVLEWVLQVSEKGEDLDFSSLHEDDDDIYNDILRQKEALHQQEKVSLSSRLH